MFIKYKDESGTTTLINLDKVEFMQGKFDKDGYILIVETADHTYSLFGKLDVEEAQSLMKYIEECISNSSVKIVDLYHWARN